MSDAEDRQAFLDMLAANRYDEDTRRVFADWLEERGLDDEASEQRRCATPEWVMADKWLHEFAGRLGTTVDNYTEYVKALRSYRDSMGGHWTPEEDGLESVYSRDITYDDVIRAGHQAMNPEAGSAFAREGWGDWFCQYGDQTARDVMGEDGMVAKFWHNWSVVTGKKPTAKQREHTVFTCSC